MCGIAGSIDVAGKRLPERATLQRMADALVHRGPDDSGFLTVPGVGFAHRRLSIVGLEDGQQPIFNEDRTVAVICNGEFFDYPERRTDLEAKGHVFCTHSDSEVLVHLYEEYGEGLFPYLKGQFAFALVDLVRGVVILGRDRVGICPLFWSRQGDTIYFASEIKALIATGAVRPEADPRGLDHLFTFFALSSRRTAFKGVQALEPGHYLKIELSDGRSAGSVTERKYWDFDFPDWGDELDGDLPHLTDSFEQVFARGGFDVVLGNPPWDSLLFREEEFFAGPRPDIAAASTETLYDDTYVCIMSDDDGVRDSNYVCDRDTAIHVRQEGNLFYYVPEGVLSRFSGGDPAQVWFLQAALESLPWVFADFEATEGSERILLDASTTIDIDGVPTDLSILVRSQELGAEVIDVPGGRWASRRNRTIITATIDGAEGVFTSRQTQNFWFVDDIGLARIDFRDEDIVGSAFVTEEVKTELVEWDLE